jgi:hypothetical protein
MNTYTMHIAQMKDIFNKSANLQNKKKKVFKCTFGGQSNMATHGSTL